MKTQVIIKISFMGFCNKLAQSDIHKNFFNICKDLTNSEKAFNDLFMIL